MKKVKNLRGHFWNIVEGSPGKSYLFEDRIKEVTGDRLKAARKLIQVLAEGTLEITDDTYTIDGNRVGLNDIAICIDGRALWRMVYADTLIPFVGMRARIVKDTREAI